MHAVLLPDAHDYVPWCDASIRNNLHVWLGKQFLLLRVPFPKYFVFQVGSVEFEVLSVVISPHHII
jgi:hypothetical protein